MAKWTKEYEDILRAKYPSCSVDINELLDLGFTHASINNKAKRLGVSVDPEYTRKKIQKLRLEKSNRTPLERLFRKIYSGIKGRKKENIKNPTDFIKHCIEVYNKQGGICSISGIHIPIPENSPNREVFCRTSCISVDRIDSKIGYVEGNIQIVHKHVNMMKLDHSEDYFLSLVKKIHDHRICNIEKSTMYQPNQYCD